ncbi:NapC/NirT family cytochrome c [candidate division KSB1 bacterium]|nr:NapC/NirT family cytochrome c [candidate division KSB1 bacterium]
MKIKRRKTITVIVFIVILVLSTGYSGWNAAHPRRSCASCHEISPSVETSLTSAHRSITCSQCHGTALSSGIHSLTEKMDMLFTHVSGREKSSQDIRMSESQIVEIMERCRQCHQIQYADWKAGGHSATYAHIFLDSTHNRTERPYWDCFRCHGMFYEGTIYDLMEPVDNKGPWKLKNPAQANVPVMPCLSCHQIHSKNEPRQPAMAHDHPRNIFYERDQRNIPFGLNVRADRMFLRADYFIVPGIFKDGKKVNTPAEYDYRLCVQCHSPNYTHEAGTEDDRTPTGVHEGLTCYSCHAAHSNNARESCGACHPAVSNCGLDVTAMNTSYISADSPNNIHSVACNDCHPKGKGM